MAVFYCSIGEFGVFSFVCLLLAATNEMNQERANTERRTLRTVCVCTNHIGHRRVWTVAAVRRFIHPESSLVHIVMAKERSPGSLLVRGPKSRGAHSDSAHRNCS